jgi:hypothetical protein
VIYRRLGVFPYFGLDLVALRPHPAKYRFAAPNAWLPASLRGFAMTAIVSIAVWAAAALIVSAVLVGIAVAVNWRVRIIDVDADKGEIGSCVTSLVKRLRDRFERRLDEDWPEKRAPRGRNCRRAAPCGCGRSVEGSPGLHVAYLGRPGRHSRMVSTVHYSVGAHGGGLTTGSRCWGRGRSDSFDLTSVLSIIGMPAQLLQRALVHFGVVKTRPTRDVTAGNEL